MKKLIAIVLTAVMCVSLLGVTCYADRWVGSDTKGWQYQYSDGSYAGKGWLISGKNKYYIKSDGTRWVGWMETKSGNKYYFNKKGVMTTGWLVFTESDGSKSKYYFDGDGIMTTGVMRKGNKTYYFYDDGRLYKTATKSTKKVIRTITTTTETVITEYENGRTEKVTGEPQTTDVTEVVEN